MKKIFLVLILVLLMSVPSFAQTSQYSIEYLIGYIGIDMGRMYDAWGPSDTIEEGYGVLLYYYKSYQLKFATDIYTNKIITVYVDSIYYKTQNNLGVGSSVNDVINVYGERYRLQEKTSRGGYAVIYDSKGIGFEIIGNSVATILIFYPQ